MSKGLHVSVAIVGMATGVLLAVSPAAKGEPPPAPAKEPAKAPASDPPAKAPAPADDLPGLDELLGIVKPKDAGKAGLPDSMKTDLDKRLSAEQTGDLFQEAVALMGDASKRLAAAMELTRAKPGEGAVWGAEAGLGTQRVQEDVIRKLDAIIAQLEQSGGGQSSRSRQQPGDPAQPQSQQRTQSRQNPTSRGGDGQTEHDGPAQQPGEMRPELDAARAAWGALPERVREMLQQGSGDKYSSLYERLTADYYKRLAEQGRTRGGAGGSGDSRP